MYISRLVAIFFISFTVFSYCLYADQLSEDSKGAHQKYYNKCIIKQGPEEPKIIDKLLCGIKDKFLFLRSEKKPWKSLLVIYPKTNVLYKKDGKQYRYKGELTTDEIEAVLNSYYHFKGLVEDVLDDDVEMKLKSIVIKDRVITKITEEKPKGNKKDYTYKFTIDDAWDDIKEYVEGNHYDSIFIHWKKGDIPARGWGLGSLKKKDKERFTFATLTEAPVSSWQRPTVGEPFLHEWLHGVSRFYDKKIGVKLPDRNADGAEIYGYERDPKAGWMDYYRDLMTEQVVDENGEKLGIPKRVWKKRPSD